MKKLILFTIDERYIEPFIVAVQSFVECNNVNEYELALVHSDISAKNIIKIKQYIYGLNLSFKVIKIKDEFTHIEVGHHFNSVIFYRLLLPELFKEYEKILYLDSDILFLDSIDELFELELKDNVLAAIPRHKFFDVPEQMKGLTTKYFASGLLLIDTKNFIDSNIYEKCLEFLKSENYVMPDQDALNAAVDKWVELDLIYGVETAFLESDDNSLCCQIMEPKIIQFSGSSKPWHFRNKHPYKYLFWEYLKKTPFKGYVPEDLTLINVIKSIIPNRIRDWIKRGREHTEQ